MSNVASQSQNTSGSKTTLPPKLDEIKTLAQFYTLCKTEEIKTGVAELLKEHVEDMPVEELDDLLCELAQEKETRRFILSLRED